MGIMIIHKNITSRHRDYTQKSILPESCTVLVHRFLGGSKMNALFRMFPFLACSYFHDKSLHGTLHEVPNSYYYQHRLESSGRYHQLRGDNGQVLRQAPSHFDEKADFLRGDEDEMVRLSA
mmetsp:Transcript_25244/g.45708  ORF Transcript_25244/g.45708 Transcript_25244/m.45708 type:complete len:121 (+) Transcript_25244:579-941(+)